MTASDPTLQRLLQAVADRVEVDWDAEAAARPDLRPTLASLRALQSVQASPQPLATAPDGADATPPPSRRGRRRTPRRWGHLEILESVGRGSFGEVLRAYDPRLQVEFALKLMLPRRGRSVDRQRFLEEARALARVRHPNIIAIYGADEHDGRLGLWTELLRGQTLEERLAEHGPLDAHEAASIGVDVARALAALHVAALVHRDVTTANVMREHGGRIVLMDFGSVLRAGTASSPEAIGTPAFLAPEVLKGGPASPRSDLYGLGVCLYRLVTGGLPFEAETLPALRASHDAGPSIPVRDRRPDLPAPVADVIERALAPRPDARYPSAAALAEALATAVAEVAVGKGMGSTHDAGTATPAAPGTHPLPYAATGFVGRTQEVATVVELLANAVVVTLTGPGGSGKTRLAQRVAEHVLPGFAEARFVDLAAEDGGGVLQAIAAGIGLRESRSPLVDAVAAAFGDRAVLLVLDNCEHVRAACAPLIETWIARCGGLRVLATSREALGVGGERRLPVPPLSLPDPALAADPVHAARADAVRLFVERARAVRPDFRLTGDVAGAVADICRRLDGMPLAIELAAARMRLLSVEEIRQRLDQRFRLLTDSPFSTLPHHRTLRAALDWSYDHLDEAERRLLRRLSVFAGGWSLAAAFAVDAGERDELASIDVLSRLVDKSLVAPDRTIGPDSRFRILETIREFAAERLVEEGEVDASRDRHAAHFAALAEQAEPRLWGPEQAAWSDRLEADHRNFMTALTWCECHDPARGLQLAGALSRFWAVRAHLSAGRDALRRILDHAPGGVSTADVARALCGAGVLAAFQMDVDDARSTLARGLEAYRVLGHSAGMARALVGLGVVAHNVEDYAEAQRLYAASLDLYRTLEDARGTAMVLNNLGGIAWRQGRWREARGLHREALDHARRARDPDVLALALTNLGFIGVVEARVDLARAPLLEALEVTRDFGLRRHAVAALETAAALFATRFESAKAARVYGASEALRTAIGAPMDAAWHAVHAAMEDRIARDLGKHRVAQERASGRTMGFETAIAEALKGLDLVDTTA